MKSLIVRGLVVGAALLAGAGLNAASALASGNGVVAFGRGTEGELGDGVRANSDIAMPVERLSGVAAVSASEDHALALLTDGTVRAWGNNEAGELGTGGTKSSDVPVRVRNLSGVTAISAGRVYSLALLSDGTVRAWGLGQRGELGDGTTTDKHTAVPVQGLEHVVAISAGGALSLALLSNGTVMAWGDNTEGSLGQGTMTGPEKCELDFDCSRVPVPVPGLSGVTAVSAGHAYGLALLGNREVRSWGTNNFKTLGDGTEADKDEPVPVSGLSGVTAISAGPLQALARLADGTAVAWGFNAEGELGNGATESSKVPVPVSDLGPVVQVAAGSGFGMALLEDGTVATWGNDSSGELGIGTFTAPESCGAPPPPRSYCTVPIAAHLGEVTGISAGGNFALALGPPFPSVNSVKPAFGPEVGGTKVTITGVGFTNASAVRFGTAEATSFSVTSPTSITAVTPAGTPGQQVDVTVTTAKGTSLVSSKDRFTYSPTVTGVSPAAGSTVGGETVTVTGTGFVMGTGTTFRFGRTSAPSAECTSSTSCTVVVPSHEPGTVDVRASVNKATSLRNPPADEFTYS